MSYRCSIAAQARWEHHDICEWIEFHKLIGFDHIYLYSNDDDPYELRKRLSPYLYGRCPFVTLIHWPPKGEQFNIYYDFLTNYSSQSEWITFLDIDEFLVIKKHGCISSLLCSMESDFDSINLNWIIYGNNGRLVRDPSLDVLPSYTRRNRCPNVHTKNITRTSSIDVSKIRAAFDNNALGFWHFWDRYPFPEMRIGNILGEDVRGYTDDFPTLAVKSVENPEFAKRIIDHGYIAHFQIKSEEDYKRRIMRGGSANIEYFRERFESGKYRRELAANNEVEDTYLAKLWLDHVRPLRCTRQYRYAPTPEYPNIALWCPTSQSSVSERETEAGAPGWCRDHGNDGFRSGAPGFKTGREHGPWWQLDLLSRRTIREVHVHNCMRDGARESLPALRFEVSVDQDEWRSIYLSEAGQAFGGIDGTPLIIAPETPVKARYLRISALGETVLNLDEVEVYGD